MDKVLKRKLKEAVDKSVRPHIGNHLNRDNDNDHQYIKDFQDAICAKLNITNPQHGVRGNTWLTEQPMSQKYKDSIDILGQLEPNKCIIEIDTVRHDQMAAKFVSRVALCGLDEPIDYVAILYDSTQKSGRQSAEKFIRYMDAIIKALNPSSSLIGIYVHIDKKKGEIVDPETVPIKIEVWDCEDQAFTISGYKFPKPCKSMSACAKGAITHFVKTHKPRPTFQELQQVFSKQRGASYIFASAEDGKGHKAEIVEDVLTGDDKPIYVDTQFRAKGHQSNWFKFVEVCKENGIIIDQDFVDKLTE